MTIKTQQRLQGYRVPKVDLRGILLSVVTLGFKRPEHTKEEAKTYEYIFEEKGIRINEIELNGHTKAVAFKPVSSADEKERIFSKGSFEEGTYIYYLDKDTIS